MKNTLRFIGLVLVIIAVILFAWMFIDKNGWTSLHSNPIEVNVSVDNAAIVDAINNVNKTLEEMQKELGRSADAEEKTAEAVVEIKGSFDSLVAEVSALKGDTAKIRKAFETYTADHKAELEENESFHTAFLAFAESYGIRNCCCCCRCCNKAAEPTSETKIDNTGKDNTQKSDNTGKDNTGKDNTQKSDNTGKDNTQKSDNTGAKDDQPKNKPCDCKNGGTCNCGCTGACKCDGCKCKQQEPAKQETPVVPKHTCSFGAWYSISETQHRHDCSCGKYEVGTHTFDANGKCTVCGYTKPAPAHVHEYDYLETGLGTHLYWCVGCVNEQGEEPCEFDASGVCKKCGYHKPADTTPTDPAQPDPDQPGPAQPDPEPAQPDQPAVHEHDYGYIETGLGTHLYWCNGCLNEQGEESCTYDASGKCIYCGYQKKASTGSSSSPAQPDPANQTPAAPDPTSTPAQPDPVQTPAQPDPGSDWFGNPFGN